MKNIITLIIVAILLFNSPHVSASTNITMNNTTTSSAIFTVKDNNGYTNLNKSVTII